MDKITSYLPLMGLAITVVGMGATYAVLKYRVAQSEKKAEQEKQLNAKRFDHMEEDITVIKKRLGSGDSRMERMETTQRMDSNHLREMRGDIKTILQNVAAIGARIPKE